MIAADGRPSGLAWLFAWSILLLVYIHQGRFRGPTAVSRLDLLHSLVLDGTWNIDKYQTNTPDKAVFRGHYFSDKAPGTVCLALAPFAAAIAVLRLVDIRPASNRAWLASSWFACACSIGMVAAAGFTAIFLWNSRQVSCRAAFLTALSIVFGAAPLPYATMMFSHALVAGCLAIAIWAAQKHREGGVRNTQRGMGRWFKMNRWDLAAGHACGWAVASEYSSGLVVMGIFLSLVWRDWRRTLPFCLAAVPPLLLIPAYSWATLGTPFALLYSYQASFPEMREGLYAIQWPDAQTAFNLLFSRARGLFFWSPFLLMAGFGYTEVYRRSPRLFWLTYGVPLLHIIVISGRVWDWPAGPTLGPRLLAPILPLLALPCAYGVQKFPRLGITLAAYSILITTLATLTNACIPFNGHPNPLIDFTIPLFLQGQFSPNLGMVLGLPPYASVALFYVILIGGVWFIWRRLPTEVNAGYEANPAHQP